MSGPFEITPDNNCELVRLEVNGVDVLQTTNQPVDMTGGTYTLYNVIANSTIHAVFEEAQIAEYDITVSWDGNGEITPNDGNPSVIKVEEGEDQEFTITPADGWELVELWIDDVDVFGTLGIDEEGGAYLFEAVEEAHSIHAVFEQLELDLPKAYFYPGNAAVSVQVSKQVQLDIQTDPPNFDWTDPRVSVTWVSNNTAVATVNKSGLLTGKAKGSAVVTATIFYNGVEVGVVKFSVKVA